MISLTQNILNAKQIFWCCDSSNRANDKKKPYQVGVAARLQYKETIAKQQKQSIALEQKRKLILFWQYNSTKIYTSKKGLLLSIRTCLENLSYSVAVIKSSSPKKVNIWISSVLLDMQSRVCGEMSGLDTKQPMHW